MLTSQLQHNLKSVFAASPETDRTIDGLRALSVLLVIFFHSFYLHRSAVLAPDWWRIVSATPVWLDWVWHGDLGVDSFFVISGYLITALLLREQRRFGKVDLRAFYMRRIARIYPAYLCLIFYGWVAGMPNSEFLWTNLLGVNNFLSLGNSFLPWTWSIAVELQFYMFFPLILLFIVRRRSATWWLGLLLLAVILLRPLIVMIHPSLYETPIYQQYFNIDGKLATWFDVLYLDLWTRAGPLLLGSLAGLLASQRRRGCLLAALSQPQLAIAMLAVLVSCIGIPLWIPYQDPTSWFYRLPTELANTLALGFVRNVFSIGVVLIIILGAHADPPITSLNWLGTRALHPVARVSYSMYSSMYH